MSLHWHNLINDLLVKAIFKKLLLLKPLHFFRLLPLQPFLVSLILQLNVVSVSLLLLLFQLLLLHKLLVESHPLQN